MQDRWSQFLIGLAQDVIEHGACEGCQMNAAMGLDQFGLLEEVLTASGKPDPRPKEGRFSPDHASAPSPTPRDSAETFEVTIAFSLPSEPSAESARRQQRDVSADLVSTVVDSGGVVKWIRSVKDRSAD